MPTTLSPITGEGTVPTGGTANQVLQKSSSTNYAYAWASLTAGGNVSTSGTITTGQYGRWAGATSLESVSAATVKSDLSLNNVTNDAQTKANVVPNTAPGTAQLLIGGGFGAYGVQTLSGSGATISINSTGVMTISAIADSAITSSGTWNTASSERRQWDGSSTNLVAATGRTSLGLGDAAMWENSSITNQSLSTTDAYITGSMITLPAGAWAQGGQYRCIFDVAKTNGTGGITVQIRIGTGGSTSDTSIFTTTYPAGTAVADQGRFEVMLNFRAAGASASATGVVNAVKNIAATATGLWGIAAQNAVGAPATSGTFNSTTYTKLGVSFNGSTSFAGTVLLVQAEYKQ